MAANERRILLVEDEPTLQRILGSVLGDAGHLVESVGTAEAAISRLDDHGAPAVDLILSDKNLPAQSGLDLLARVRQQERDDNMTRGFVLVTGYPSRESAMEVLEHGGNGYLVKPFRSLIHAVETITAMMDAPLRDFRVATDLAQAAVATLMRDESEGFLPQTKVAVLVDDESQRDHLQSRLKARGATVVSVEDLRAATGGPRLLIAARVEDLETFAKTAPQTGLLLADGGASFRALKTLIQSGGGGVFDPTLVPGAA